MIRLILSRWGYWYYAVRGSASEHRAAGVGLALPIHRKGSAVLGGRPPRQVGKGGPASAGSFYMDAMRLRRERMDKAIPCPVEVGIRNAPGLRLLHR